MSHLTNIKMRFTVNNFTTGWQRLEKGIMAGCTVSVILVVVAMNMLRGSKAEDGSRQPACRACMDDVTVMTGSLAGIWCILIALETMVNWARMKIKPTKSRKLTITKGKLGSHIFIIQVERIPPFRTKA